MSALALEVDEVGTPSLWAIAGAVGVAHKTVIKDVKQATGTQVPVQLPARSTELRDVTPMLLTFTVPDEPVAMPRPRVAVRGGKAHGYTPTKASEAMWRIRQAAVAALGDRPRFEGAVQLTAVAYVRQPASIAKRDRLTALPTKRPDTDNYCKTLLDGLSVLWADDAQVTDLCVRKRFAVDSSPRWDIRVESV